MRWWALYVALAACGDQAEPPSDGALPACEPAAAGIIAPLWTAGRTGTPAEPGAFGKADAMAYGGHGLLLVGDEDPAFDRLTLFDLDAVAAGEAPVVGTLDGWESIGGIARQPGTGRIFVAELRADRVRVFDWAADPRQAPHLVEVGRFGTPALDPDAPGPGEFVRAQTVAFDAAGRAYVTDDGKEDGATGARHVLVFAADLTYEATFGRGDLEEPENLALDEVRDRIYVADEGRRDVAVFGFASRQLTTRFGAFVGIPNGLAVDAAGTIYVMDEDGQVVVFDPDTLAEIYRFGEGTEVGDPRPGTFRSPDTLIVDDERGLLVVTDQGHDRIQAFDLADVQARACAGRRELVVRTPPRVVRGGHVPVQVELRRGAGVERSPARGLVARVDEAAWPLVAGVAGGSVPASELGTRVLTATLGELRADVAVEVVDPPRRALTGTLTPADLVWSPDDGVIALAGTTAVPAGSTLRILPGTLVSLGPDAVLEIRGDLEAVGTAAAPISFFAADAAPWATISHVGGRATYAHVFLTGGGAGERLGHCCAPMVRTDGTALVATDTVWSDAPGKGLFVRGGTARLHRATFARVGMGAEFEASARVEVWESTFASLAGPDDNDGLYLHEDGAYRLGRIAVTDVTDDGLDLEYASPEIRGLIVLGAADKAVSINGGHPTLLDALLAESAIGFGVKDGRGAPSAGPTCTGCTLASNGEALSLRAVDGVAAMIRPVLVDSILWGNGTDLVTAYAAGDVTLTRTIVGDARDVSGTPIEGVDPEFRDPDRSDYRLGAASPARSLGDAGGALGWSGR